MWPHFLKSKHVSFCSTTTRPNALPAAFNMSVSCFFDIMLFYLTKRFKDLLFMGFKDLFPTTLQAKRWGIAAAFPCNNNALHCWFLSLASQMLCPFSNSRHLSKNTYTKVTALCCHTFFWYNNLSKDVLINIRHSKLNCAQNRNDNTNFVDIIW